ncbi:hypothetical protein MKX03_000599 [Papaver bracteatum]|nr:hypothetical protein MKX03_000599 [Papaver bracteatum]
MNSLCFSWMSILLVFLINFHAVHVHGASDKDLISTVCKKAVADDTLKELKYGFCVSSLQADPKSKTYNLFDLGLLSFNNNLKKGLFIRSYIQKLLKDGKQSPNVMERLKGCSQDYAFIGRDMEDAIGAFGSGDFAMAGIPLDIAYNDDIPACQGRFNGGLTSPLTKYENEFRQLLNISFTLTDMNTPSYM